MVDHLTLLGPVAFKRLESALNNDSTASNRGAVIDAGVLASTMGYGCKCEDVEHMAVRVPHVRGHMYPGMPVSELRDLCAGCTTPAPGEGLYSSINGVCRRLDNLRRKYGV